MARIAGVELPSRKPIVAALRYIYGIGPTKSQQIIDQAGVAPNVKAGDLSGDEVARIRNIIEKEEEVEGELRRRVQMNIKRLMDLGCYRGLRHRKGLPARGQRTRTNSRTRKGPRRGPITGKKKATKK